MFQAAMQELNVEVKVEQLELATWIDRIVTTDEYDISWDMHCPTRRRSGLDAVARLLLPAGPQNISRYTDDEISQLISQGGASSIRTSAR